MAPIIQIDLMDETSAQLMRRQSVNFPEQTIIGLIAGIATFLVIFFVALGVWLWFYCRPTKNRGHSVRFDDSATMSGDTLASRFSNDSLLKEKPEDFTNYHEYQVPSRMASDETVLTLNHAQTSPSRPEPTIENPHRFKRHSMKEAVAVRMEPALGNIRTYGH